MGRFVVARSFFTAFSLQRVMVSLIDSPLNCWKRKSARRLEIPSDFATSSTPMPLIAFFWMKSSALESRWLAGFVLANRTEDANPVINTVLDEVTHEYDIITDTDIFSIAAPNSPTPCQ